MSEVKSKKCSKCGEIKPFLYFTKKKGGKYGYSSSCKDCFNAYCKKHYKENKKDKLEKCKKYRDSNKDKIKEYYLKNRDRLISANKENYHNNKEFISKRRKKFYSENREMIIDKKRKYYYENRQLINKRVRTSRRQRLISDDHYRIEITIRDRFRAAIKSNISSKSWRELFKLTGYTSSDYLKSFNKKLFTEYKETSKYHIDHIIPMRLYDFSILEDIQKCWNPRNLRIITAKDNMSKGGRLEINLIKSHNIEDLLPKGLKIE